jgi:hypothetical protein
MKAEKRITSDERSMHPELPGGICSGIKSVVRKHFKRLEAAKASGASRGPG